MVIRIWKQTKASYKKRQINWIFQRWLHISNGANRAPHEIKIDLAVLPVATCQGYIHHFSSLFLGLPCFPCSKSWRMTRFSLSSTLWVLVSEKCTSIKYLVLSIFCCKQGVNRPVVLVWMLSLMFLLLGAKKAHDLQFTVPCAFSLLFHFLINLTIYANCISSSSISFASSIVKSG